MAAIADRAVSPNHQHEFMALIDDTKWTPAEKKIARRVFDAAREREYSEIIARMKALATSVDTPETLWAVHDFLSEERRRIDEKYDYRYSRLIFAFAAMLREKWISEEELAGLADDKIQKIIFLATI
jgi:hypothetical protein